MLSAHCNIDVREADGDAGSSCPFMFRYYVYIYYEHKCKHAVAGLFGE